MQHSGRAHLYGKIIQAMAAGRLNDSGGKAANGAIKQAGSKTESRDL
jgi:hypothetical protein